MSLDLLKERFGGSKSTDKKESDKQKLNEMFISKPAGDIKSFKAQYQDELVEKDRIIENLKQELNSQWLTNQTAFNTKKLYEDKIKKMDIVDSTKLIPTLVEVSKQKQGNVKLDWMSWLEIPESNYLFQINESLAKKVFQENNLLIDRLKYKQRGGDAPYTPAKNYALSFSGDRSGATKTFVSTTFNPDTYSLWNGFTISFWVRPDEEMNQKSVILGTRASSPVARFHFGFSGTGVNNIGVGIGGNDVTGINNPMEVGNWYNWVISYTGTQFDAGERKLRLWINTDERMSNNNSTSWGNQDEATESYTHGIYFGGRNTEGSGYSSGFACALDEVAIYNRCIDSVGTFANEVYNAGTTYNHLNNGQSGLVGYWKMNEGSGTTVEDLSGTGNDGTLTTDGTGLPTWEEIGSYE
jgi:hypothetical protein